MARNRQEEKPRTRIDARSPTARAANLRGAKYDASGNLVGGQDATTGQSISIKGSSNIDKLKSGEMTPGLNSLDAAHPALPQRTNFVEKSSPAQIAMDTRAKDPAKYWGSMSFAEKREASRGMEEKKRNAFDAGRMPQDPVTARAKAIGRTRGEGRAKEIASSIPGAFSAAQAGTRAATVPETRGLPQKFTTPYGKGSVRQVDPTTPKPPVIAAKSDVVAPNVTAFSTPGMAAPPSRASAFRPPTQTSAPAATVAAPRAPTDPLETRMAASKQDPLETKMVGSNTRPTAQDTKRARMKPGDDAAKQMFGGLNTPALPTAWKATVNAAKKIGSKLAGNTLADRRAASGARDAFQGYRDFQKRGLIAAR